MLRVIYRILLYACPPAVRREYGAEMEDGVRPLLAVERTRRTRAGRVLAGMRGLADVLIFACRARWHGWGTTRDADHHTRSRRPLVILRDVRGTMRLMRSQPALTAGIVLMLALGIGATTAIFSVVYGVLLKPLPFPEPDRLVQVWGSMPSRGLATMSLTEANFWDMRDMNQSLSDFGALHGASFTLTGFEMPERVTGATVSAGFFRSLGVRPVAGRIFEPGEDEPGASTHAGGALARALDPPLRQRRGHRRPRDHAGWPARTRSSGSCRRDRRGSTPPRSSCRSCAGPTRIAAAGNTPRSAG